MQCNSAESGSIGPGTRPGKIPVGVPGQGEKEPGDVEPGGQNTGECLETGTVKTNGLQDSSPVEDGGTSDRSDKNSKASDISTDRSEKTSGDSVSTGTSGHSGQRLARQLEEVRQGIYRLLSESDSGGIEGDENSAEEIDTRRQIVGEHTHTVTRSQTIIKTETVARCELTSYSDLGVTPLEGDTPGYQADEEVDQSEEDSASQSLEINSVVVPGCEDVVEKQELELCEKEMGCVSGERETRDKEDRGTDSGIERGVGSSRGGSAEGWLARLSSRVTGRSRLALGSGGQSSDSQASSPDGRRGSMDSPREGGFGEGSLEQRVRELWVRLAQMEAEKLRAVEQAVEEERKNGTEIIRKERNVLDREKENLVREKEQLRQEKEAIEQRMKLSSESQVRQAELVNRLQVS